MEFTADTRILRTAQPTIAAAGSQELIVGDLVLKFRLPTSRDLAKIAGLSDVNDARSLLLSRCIESAKRGENLIALDDLPSEAVSAIEDALTSLDPLAEIRLNLVCAECDHSWEVLFDIQAFLWQELRRKAQRLLEEIHMLASNYSWSESAILAMSDARRQYYLGLILQ
ncbi:MAG: T4 family baseplate hub assembly chaperone [Planctomycetota bacterium]